MAAKTPATTNPRPRRAPCPTGQGRPGASGSMFNNCGGCGEVLMGQMPGKTAMAMWFIGKPA